MNKFNIERGLVRVLCDFGSEYDLLRLNTILITTNRSSRGPSTRSSNISNDVTVSVQSLEAAAVADAAETLNIIIII